MKISINFNKSYSTKTKQHKEKAKDLELQKPFTPSGAHMRRIRIQTQHPKLDDKFYILN